MASSNEDRGFNSVRDSHVAQRARNKQLQTYTLFGVFALLVVMLAALVIMAVGGIVANVGNSGNKTPTGTPDDERVNWGSITVTNTDAHKGDLLIVNNDHVYHFPSTSDHLAEIYAQLITHSPRTYQQGLSKYMDKDALLALDTFLTDFCTATGKNNVLIRYAYRSKEDQKAFETKPGYSDHHTGLGCQLKYTVEGRNYELSTDPTYNWLYENAHKYGFVVRYPADKTDKTGISDYSDYFRYVGVAHATYMHANNLCLEEYVELLGGYTHKKPLGISAADGKYYEVYSVEVNGSATVKVPTNYNYTISGNNVGGVIITVDRSATAEVETTAGTEASAN